MTVRELVIELLKYPMNAVVWIEDRDEGASPATRVFVAVQVNEKKKYVIISNDEDHSVTK